MWLWDYSCQQITSVTINKFSLFSKKNPTSLFLRDNQNQMKNTCPFYIAFQVLKVYTS